jgi:Tfp pilus assembly protein PilX
MNDRRSRLNRARPPQALRRGAALYVAVTATTMIVSVLGLSAMAIVRIERRQASAVNTRQIARSHARSAVELALQRINGDPNWRSNYANDAETAVTSLGNASAGSISWSVVDSDGDTENADAALRLKGIGRIGSTVQVSSVGIQVAPSQLRGQASGLTNDNVDNDEWWCQYVRPTPPPGALGWRITSVEIYARTATAGQTFHVRLYKPLANNMPSVTAIDSVENIPSGSVGGWRWYPIAFSGSYWISPSEGVCLALESATASDPIDIMYNSSVSESNSALIRGYPAWQSPPDTAKALRYRIHGYYSNSNGVQPIPGAWDWDVP